MIRPGEPDSTTSQQDKRHMAQRSSVWSVTGERVTFHSWRTSPSLSSSMIQPVTEPHSHTIALRRWCAGEAGSAPSLA
jgi:hypothetical protein